LRRAVAALVVTAVVVVLLARFETEPPVTRNPNAALEPVRTPRALAAPRSTPAPDRSSGEGTRSVLGPALTTPFSAIQVKAYFTGRRLTGIETVSLSGDGPYTEALNARAEPVLRESALKAGNAKVDVVSGATSTSKIWLESLQGAIDKARRGRG
jgi:uncharacterized protein with FMN-binding domain